MSAYRGLAEQASDGSWFVQYPDLPGCTSSATTLDELADIGREAVELWIDDVRADGLAVPVPRSLDDLLAAGYGDNLAFPRPAQAWLFTLVEDAR